MFYRAILGFGSLRDIMAPPRHCYYKVLKLQEKSTDSEIRNAYKKLVKLYHPDKNKFANAKEKFQELQQAYEVLRDPVKRARYDRERNAAPAATGSSNVIINRYYFSNPNSPAGFNFTNPFSNDNGNSGFYTFGNFGNTFGTTHSTSNGNGGFTVGDNRPHFSSPTGGEFSRSADLRNVTATGTNQTYNSIGSGIHFTCVGDGIVFNSVGDGIVFNSVGSNVTFTSTGNNVTFNSKGSNVSFVSTGNHAHFHSVGSNAEFRNTGHEASYSSTGPNFQLYRQNP